MSLSMEQMQQQIQNYNPGFWDVSMRRWVNNRYEFGVCRVSARHELEAWTKAHEIVEKSEDCSFDLTLGLLAAAGQRASEFVNVDAAFELLKTADGPWEAAVCATPVFSQVIPAHLGPVEATA